jgi:hypothetical protein
VLSRRRSAEPFRSAAQELRDLARALWGVEGAGATLYKRRGFGTLKRLFLLRSHARAVRKGCDTGAIGFGLPA